MFQTPHRIQAGSQNKANLFSSNRFLIAAADLEQFTKSGKRCSLHGLHAPFDQRAVFILQRNDIRHRAQRHQFCILFPQGRFRITQFLQRLTDFKSHSHTGKPFKRVPAVSLFGIDNGISHRQYLRRTVMVRNNDVHPAGRFRHFPDAADPTVHRNDQRDSFLIQRLQRFLVQSVAFPFPFGNIGTDIRI